MRLIGVKSLVAGHPPLFKEFFGDDVPPYAILSHRWSATELYYQDLTDPYTFWDKRLYSNESYKKIQNTAKFADSPEYDCKWVWCDTCCIDKRNSAELTEAINSMFAWYKNATVCFAYLADWPDLTLPAFTQSIWFTRCWTLQELVAPQKLVFFNKNWETRYTRVDLVDQIAVRTRIDRDVLLGRKGLDEISLAQRMSWSADRIATRCEDEAYCLLGIFDVNMPPLYGEGRKAFVRLQEEIVRRNADRSVLVWASPVSSRNLFPLSPSDYAHSGKVRQEERSQQPFTLSNLGMEIELEMRQIKCNTYAAYLACVNVNGNRLDPVSLILQCNPEGKYFVRTGSCLDQEGERGNREGRKTFKVTILRSVPSRFLMLTPLYGFRLGGRCRSLVLVNDWDLRHYWDIGRWENEGTDLSASIPIFRIPDGEAPSIATMVLFLGKERLLIQLLYDFNFNPCCYISRQNKSSAELFDFRTSRTDGSEELMEWLDQTSGWTKIGAHQETENTHFYTGQRAWAAKAVNREKFTALIPTSITKPYANIEMSFAQDAPLYDWVFDIHPTEDTQFWDLGFRVLAYDPALKDCLTRLSHLGTKS